jgi:S-adenosylmethionine:tRNA ribosyltransferase-isomerase
MSVPKINLNDYTYILPEERIAKFPLENRDQSKLLVYEKGNIYERQFFNLPELLPANSLLVFNNTKVIPARIFFRRSTGAIIEIFLLEPVLPSPVVAIAMGAKGKAVWKCMVGNLKKWKDEEVLNREVTAAATILNTINLEAKWFNKEKLQIEFSWNNEEVSFLDILNAAGKIPIPPYLNREANENDNNQYQTVYAKNEGAVAAPTAGLHFTDKVLQQLSIKGIEQEFITLHVSAGTFQPVKNKDDVQQHEMHSEQIIFSKSNIEKLLQNAGNIIPVGTTSMRSLESLYWYGVKLLGETDTDFHVTKLFAYENEAKNVSVTEALQAVLQHMNYKQLAQIHGNTEILIMPGYKFKMCKGLITNFHQPDSTLILLVAAFIGDNWRKVYDYALKNNFRFLSYGDSSLLFPE